MKSIVKLALSALLAVFLTGCVTTGGNKNTYNIYGQNLQVPNKFLNKEKRVIKKDCGLDVDGTLWANYKGKNYIAFSSDFVPHCDIYLGEKVIIEEIKYNRDTALKVTQKALDYITMPLKILDAVLDSKSASTISSNGTNGVWKLAVSEDIEFGKPYGGKIYTFREDQQFDVIVKSPFGTKAVDKFDVGLVALYYPQNVTKPDGIGSYTDEVEITISKVASDLDEIIFHTLQNRNNVSENDRLLMSYIQDDPNVLARARKMSGLKISPDLLNPKPQQQTVAKKPTVKKVTTSLTQKTEVKRKRLNAADLLKAKKSQGYVDLSDGI